MVSTTSRSQASARLARRLFVRTLGAVSAAVGVGAFAQQDDFPSRPIRLVVPYPPGGFTDILGRLLAQQLSEQLRQPVAVENKGGGGSTIGTSLVVKTPADGYTLLLVAPDVAINQSLIADRLTYDAQKDLVPVTLAAFSPMVVVANPSLPVKTVQELVALAKARPGQLNYGSGGNGTGAHLATELFKARAGIDMVHVPYKGNGPALNDLLGGQVSLMFMQLAVAQPHIAAGRLRALATPSGKRLAALPDVPTLAETVLPGFDVAPWFGVMAPAGTPMPIVTRLSQELRQALKSPEVAKQLAAQGAEPVGTAPAEFGSFLRSEVDRWAKVVKESGARID